MSEILLVRHAETDWKGTFCGHTDPGLNAAGRAQLAAILDEIGDRRLTTVISSDLRRARETAAPIAERAQVKPLLRAGLREMYFGAWEGLTWQQIEARDPAISRSWHENFPRLPAPGGELMEDFEERVVCELDYLHSLPADSVAVVVTHGGVLRAMLKNGNIGHKDAWQQELPYGVVIPLQRPSFHTLP